MSLKPATIARLHSQTRLREAQWQEVLRRAEASLTQAGQHQEVLSAYRARLAAAWQSGAVLPAGQARRFALFSAASRSASRQVEAQEARAAAQAEDALQNLAELSARLRHLALAAAQEAAALDQAREDTALREIPARIRHPYQP